MSRLIETCRHWQAEMERSAATVQALGLHDVAGGNTTIAETLARAAFGLTALRNSLERLADATAQYRKHHDLLGDDHRTTGRAWDQMRRAEVVARHLLSEEDYQ